MILEVEGQYPFAEQTKNEGRKISHFPEMLRNGFLQALWKEVYTKISMWFQNIGVKKKICKSFKEKILVLCIGIMIRLSVVTLEIVMGKLVSTYKSISCQTVTQGNLNHGVCQKILPWIHPFSTTGRCISTSRGINQEKRHGIPEIGIATQK